MENSRNSTNEKSSAIPMDNFNSTVKLTESNASGLNEKEGDYNPFEHRVVDHPNSDGGALAHLLKGSLGSGILAMPNAFKNSGLAFGLVGTIVVGIICTHCVHILVRTSHYLCKKERIPVLGYATTAEVAFKTGPKKFRPLSGFAKNFVNWSLVATYYSAACVYVVFIAVSFKQVIDFYYPDYQLNVRIYMLIFLLPLIAISEIRSLKYLVPFSIMANLFIVVGFSITLYYMFQDLPPIADRKLIATAGQLPLFFSTVIFAMEGIGVVMPLENSMKTPNHFIGCPGVLNIAMGVVVALYTVIGFVGYWQYGEETYGSVTLNLPIDDILAQVVKLLIAIAILFTYGLQFFVPSDIVWTSIKDKVSPKWSNTVQNTFRAVAVAVTVAVAAAVPDLGPIISLVGAVCFSNLGLMCPAIIEIAAYYEHDAVAVAAAVPDLGPIISLVGAVCFSNLGLMCPAIIEIAAYYEHDAGKTPWRLIKNIAIIIVALLALVSGTYSSILEIIDTY